ncbi:MAG: response regulator [Desulfomonilaceae bacterium]|nr:response regulator [Desulfomonilaceae bacterium]
MNGEPLVILLVEDNPDHAELIVRSFEEHRVANKIIHVSDGEAALDYLFHRGEYADDQSVARPHVILLDLRLPKIDGLEVLKEIKAAPELRRIPVVALTTSESERDMMGAYNRHVNSYLVKPVDFEKFGKLMDDLGFYWLAWNRKPPCDASAGSPQECPEEA